MTLTVHEQDVGRVLMVRNGGESSVGSVGIVQEHGESEQHPAQSRGSEGVVQPLWPPFTGMTALGFWRLLLGWGCLPLLAWPPFLPLPPPTPGPSDPILIFRAFW